MGYWTPACAGVTDQGHGRRLAPHLAFADGDAVYQKLIDAVAGLDDAAAMKLMAKLIHFLANHIGDEAVLEAAIEEVCRANTR